MALLNGGTLSGLVSGIFGGQPASAGFNWSGTGILSDRSLSEVLDLVATGQYATAADNLLGSGELSAQASALDGSAYVDLTYDTAAPTPPGQDDVTAWTLGLTAGAVWQDAAVQFSGTLGLLFDNDGGVDVTLSGGPEPYTPPAPLLDNGAVIA
jgi:hypothetical protein